MAASLGSLVVSLGLNAAEFTSGLSRAEFESQRAMRKIKDDFDAIGKAIGIAAVAAGAFAVKMGSDFVAAAADLDDMAEKTGASVEELSKLSQQAHISGTSIETLETTLVQLSKHLQGSGEESKNTTRALAALGLEASQLKNLDTAEALRIVAVELNKFADGSGKAALAIDLLGKSGAQALPFLKDMANDGELAANVTAKQAAEAEELGKAWRRLTLEAKNIGQAIALDIVPYLKDLIEQFKVGKEVAGGFWNAMRLFGASGITKDSAAGKIQEITTEIGKLQEKLADKRFAAPNWQSSINKQIEDSKKQLEFAKLMMRQAEDARLAGQGGNEAPTAPPRRLNYEAATNAKAAAVKKEMSLDDLLAKAAMKRLEVQEEAERNATKVAEREAEERRKIHEKELQDSLAIAVRIQKADVEAQQYLQKEVRGFEVAPVYLDGMKDKIEEVSEASRDMGHAIGTAFEDAVLRGEGFRDVLHGLLDDIARIVLRLTVTKPLETALAGALSSGFGSLFSGGTAGMAAQFPNSGNVEGGLIGAFATGTDYVPRTGLALLHQGEAVIPAGQNMRGNTIDARTYIDARGATQDAIPGMVAALNNHARAIERMQAGDGYRRGDSTRSLY